MRTVVVTDIFGKTNALESLCQQFSTDFHIVDPYLGDEKRFKSEAMAYECFMKECGVEAYAGVLEGVLCNQIDPVNLLGFSVGASAIWQLSDSLSQLNVRHAAGFYGSQIRHDLSKIPSVNLDLFIPKEEDAFDVAVFKSALKDTPNVVLNHTAYKHGFMNQHSTNFDSTALTTYLNWLRTWACESPIMLIGVFRKKAKLMYILEFSERSGLSIDTLSYYEKKVF